MVDIPKPPLQPAQPTSHRHNLRISPLCANCMRPSPSVLPMLLSTTSQRRPTTTTFSGTPSPRSPTRPTPNHTLKSDIEEWFESMDHLRDELTDAALSMFGKRLRLADQRDVSLPQHAHPMHIQRRLTVSSSTLTATIYRRRNWH